MIDVIPVLDLRKGRAVHAIAGRRSEYRPVISPLCTSADPVELAQAMIAVRPTAALYVADLDAIMEGDPQTKLIQRLVRALPVPLLCDGGITTPDSAKRWADLGVVSVIGSETVHLTAGPFRLDHCTVSIDTHAGRILGDWERFHTFGVANEYDTLGLTRAMLELTGTERVIRLDLGAVGNRQGPWLDDWLTQSDWPFPGVKLAIGGGVRIADWPKLAELGIGECLMGSAYHDGLMSAT